MYTLQVLVASGMYVMLDYQVRSFLYACWISNPL
jgi:hypothetical protein